MNMNLTRLLPRLLPRLLLPATLLCGQGFACAQDADHEKAAAAMIIKFRAAGADRAALTKNLRPTTDDYTKVFTTDFARKLEASQNAMWDSPPTIGILPAQTEMHVSKATTEDFQKGALAAKEFAGGYAKIADKLQPGVTLFRFKFVKPGESSGMVIEGIAFVNGHWRIFPKPWRALE